MLQIFSNINISSVLLPTHPSQSGRIIKTGGEARRFHPTIFFLAYNSLPGNFLYEYLAVSNLLVDRMNYARGNQLFSLKQTRAFVDVPIRADVTVQRNKIVKSREVLRS
jgi:hypothetical protein